MALFRDTKGHSLQPCGANYRIESARCQGFAASLFPTMACSRGMKPPTISARKDTFPGKMTRSFHAFTRLDTATSTKVAVINEAFARKYFAGRNPIGYHITSTFGKNQVTFEVVGVSRNVRDHRLSGEVPPRYYIVPEQSMEGPLEFGSIMIRTAADPDQLIPSVRRAILSVNQDLYPDELQPLVQNVDTFIAQPRVLARLCTLFGSIALLLAATGLYGVLSYGVTRRTNEIGIRMALGAGRSNVVGMILRETSVMIAIGVALGMGAIAAVTRLMKAVLYGLSSLDPATIGGALLLLGLVALVAGYIPATRAARVNPTTALRHE